MVDNKYAVAYSEVLEILKYVPIEDYNKIPESKINLFKANANYENTFKYDPNKTLEEQNVSKIAKGIIILLFRDYWANEKQKNKIIVKQNYDRMKLEEAKRAKYSNNIFQNINNYKQENNAEKSTRINEVAIVEYKESFFKKCINKIKEKFINRVKKIVNKKIDNREIEHDEIER